jgi:hypothetical protein
LAPFLLLTGPTLFVKEFACADAALEASLFQDLLLFNLEALHSTSEVRLQMMRVVVAPGLFDRRVT